MIKEWTDKKVTLMLKNNGYYFDHQTGSHRIYKNRNGRMIPINRNANRMVMQRLIKEYGLSCR